MAADMRVTRLGAIGIRPQQMGPIFKRVMLVYPQGWIANYLPIHFTKRGATRYRYAPRAGEPGSGRAFRGSYTHRKLLRFHHTLPLVWSGEGRRSALANRYARSTRSTGRAVVPARVFNFKNPASRTDPRAELTAVAELEQQHLERLAQSKTNSEINRAASRHA